MLNMRSPASSRQLRVPLRRVEYSYFLIRMCQLSPPPPFLDDLLHILFRPGDKAIDMGQEGQRPVGQRVLDSRRHLGIDLPTDEAILLERPQGGGQHLLRDVGDALPQASLAMPTAS